MGWLSPFLRLMIMKEFKYDTITNLYHYTAESVLERILEEGLLIDAPKQTIEGQQLGVYVTNDPRMNFFKTLSDTLFKPWEKIYRLEIDPQYIKSLKLDREFHIDIWSKWDLRKELKLFEGHLMFYIPESIPPEAIIDVVLHTDIRRYCLFTGM